MLMKKILLAEDNPFDLELTLAGLAEYRLPLPAGLPASDVAVVRLTSPTFTPGGGDTRRLGVAVSRVALE